MKLAVHKERKRGITMAVLNEYNINAMATQISKDFYIDGDRDDLSHVLVDEMRLFAIDMKSRVTFISRAKN
jgi:hypothetical protein